MRTTKLRYVTIAVVILVLAAALVSVSVRTVRNSPDELDENPSQPASLWVIHDEDLP
ncbi:MAG TPA: hypothetical protein PKM41_13400 [Deltaproteobacteria bacterium]|jgi:flagellar basal body-associated protein FliL|nr:hypothetical protein [Deltaproteobacteria bacterium]HOI07543.1 hypothetical protein [Deltaproteobacteria bacterium]